MMSALLSDKEAVSYRKTGNFMITHHANYDLRHTIVVQFILIQGNFSVK